MAPFYFPQWLARPFNDRYKLQLERLLTTNAVTLPAGMLKVKSSKVVTSGRVGWLKLILDNVQINEAGSFVGSIA